jgi:hypothetical protein
VFPVDCEVVHFYFSFPRVFQTEAVGQLSEDDTVAAGLIIPGAVIAVERIFAKKYLITKMLPSLPKK